MAPSAELLGTRGTGPGAAGCPSSGGNPRARRDSDRLDRLRDGLVDALRLRPQDLPALAAVPCDLSALRDELADILQAAAQELAAKVRGELPCWTAALEHFEQLSRCRYLALPGNLVALRDELESAGRQARQVAEALEALGRGRFLPPPHHS